MKRLILPLLLSNLLWADCSQNQRQQAQELWQQSQTMQGRQKSQILEKALETCPLSEIEVEFYLYTIEEELNQGGLSLKVLNRLKEELSNVRSMNNNLFLSDLRSRNSDKITKITNEIATIEEKVETNQEKLNQLRAYKENSGVQRAFGSGERLMLPLLFANGSAKVSNNNTIRALIKRIETTLKEDKNAEFSITGYASSIGGAIGNIKLSEKRANNTKRYIEKHIPKGHISTSGSGESDLICNSGYPEDIGNREYKCRGGRENEASSRRIEVLRRR